jgi:hypothetical protein
MYRLLLLPLLVAISFGSLRTKAFQNSGNGFGSRQDLFRHKKPVCLPATFTDPARVRPNLEGLKIIKFWR